MELVAIDLEGSGAHDRENEAILEIAVVPIVDWQPDMAAAYSTLINPERAIPQRPWISPGLTDAVLSEAPKLVEVEPELARRLNGKYLVGHNIGVDWRLLHRRCPGITPSGLIDTLRLARQSNQGGKRSLTAMIDHFALTKQVGRLAAGSVPHRALWDTVAVALLLRALTRATHCADVQLGGLVQASSAPPLKGRGAPSQPSLFD
ncbi:3'-5' exonuclease [Phytohabitans suffuscus]|uniref:Exonuclease domain-containing protein n=1 Tax=Phytohabitans suffuscus TaxID=624315 RepID=A0A6F8YSF9_9ACTN|nr:3'-5' exonuclease [Phytohabitans suffuscus]BCB88868.1 hypothetical protein Psuf_061810 [Phytohabitans suffuscus]